MFRSLTLLQSRAGAVPFLITGLIATGLLTAGLLTAADDVTAMLREVQDTYGFEVAETVAGRVSVTKVVPDAPAALSGLRKGDVILAVDGKLLMSSKGLGQLLKSKRPGQVTNLEVSRGDNKRQLEMVAVKPVIGKTGVRRAGKETALLGMFLIEDPQGKALVSNVTEKSLASNAGLHKGDIIESINGNTGPTFSELIDATARSIGRMQPGDEVKFRVLRKGEATDFVILLPEGARVVLPRMAEESLAPDQVTLAVVRFVPFSSRQSSGFLLLRGVEEGVEIRGVLKGLPTGDFRVIIHEFGDVGDLENDSAGAIFDPYLAARADAPMRQPAGDLGIITPDKTGQALLQGEFPGVLLNDRHSIVGRVLAIHVATPPGEALGPMLMYGVVGLGNPIRQMKEFAQ